MKNKDKGFTLVELMAVIIIISLVAILTFPNIINQIKKSKKSTTNNINDIVISAAKRYVSDNPSDFEENEYCLSIDTLVSNDYVKEDMFKDSDILNKKVIKLANATSKYEIMDKDKCQVCNADYCDEEGNKYTEIAYLESTGTQYIDTGVKLTQDSILNMKITVTSQGNYNIFGSRTSATENNFGVLFSSQYNNYSLDFDKKIFHHIIVLKLRIMHIYLICQVILHLILILQKLK